MARMGLGYTGQNPESNSRGRNNQAHQRAPVQSPHPALQPRRVVQGTQPQVGSQYCCSFRTCRLVFSNCSALMIYLIPQQRRRKYPKTASDRGTPQECQRSVFSASLESCSAWHQLSKAKSLCQQHSKTGYQTLQSTTDGRQKASSSVTSL